ncbi:hypothetical protein ABTZ58_23560 [Streptomyces sp. NPDC094143]|uniref:hypothetical protein n=1 Tax=Streptomyces sp. NPDC094143 TaxID=3155310 RepID=UPI00332AAE59
MGDQFAVRVIVGVCIGLLAGSAALLVIGLAYQAWSHRWGGRVPTGTPASTVRSAAR